MFLHLFRGVVGDRCVPAGTEGGDASVCPVPVTDDWPLLRFVTTFRSWPERLSLNSTQKHPIGEVKRSPQ